MSGRSLVTRFHILELMILAAVTATALAKTPAGFEFAAHWGPHNQPDWLWPRDIALSILPAAALSIAAGFALAGAAMSRHRLEMYRHILDPWLSGLLALCLGLQFGLLLTASGSDLDLIRILAFVVAAILSVLGIVLCEAERHTYAGMRLPWQIRGDDVWRLAHRVTGSLFVLGALALAGLAWLAPDLANLLIALPVVLCVPILVGRLVSLIGGR